MNKKVLILLSTYNGEKYLSEQVESLENQEGVDLDILIRDDGSSDSTVKLIEQLQSEYSNIRLFQGENLGFAKSFWDLVKNAEGYDYYGFCDQDDIWMSDKAARAVSILEKEDKSRPLLYTGDVICVDSNGEKISDSPFKGKVLNNYETFQRSILPGCTYFFNDNALQLLKKYDGSMYAHDWAVYAIVKTFGKVVYDSKPGMKYRIHSNNTIGADSKLKTMKNKIKLFFKKSPCVRMHFAKDFYDCYGEYIQDAELKDAVYNLGHYQENSAIKRKLLNNKNFRGFTFKFFVLLNRV